MITNVAIRLITHTVRKTLATVHRLGLQRHVVDEIIELIESKPSGYHCLIPQREIDISQERYRPVVEKSPYYYEGVYLQPELSLYELERPLFHSNRATLALQDRRLIAESDMNLERARTNPLFNSVIPFVRPLPGHFTTISSRYGGYSHFMIDMLPRTYALWAMQPPLPTLLLSAKLPNAYCRILSYVLPESVSIRYLPANNRWYLPSQFTLISYPVNNQSAYLPPEIRDFLREKIFHVLNLSPTHTYNKRIYISRQDAAKRQLINENEIVQYLAQFGFESYTLGQLSIEEQIKLFHSAEIVVGPHGAGFANLLFAGPQTRVIELFGTNHPLTWYFLLAQSMEQDYHFVYSRERVGRHDDFTIEIKDFAGKIIPLL